MFYTLSVYTKSSAQEIMIIAKSESIDEIVVMRETVFGDCHDNAKVIVCNTFESNV